MVNRPAFARTIGIDYSGAETPTASLKGLRVYLAEGDGLPMEVQPPPSPRKYWTRRGIAEWLVERLAEDVPTLVGIDHGFSFPLRYFEVNYLKPEWPAFLDDFQHHWPTDQDHIYVDFVRDGSVGNGAARTGNSRWRRLTEERAGSAKSVFHFDVQGTVAKSTHADERREHEAAIERLRAEHKRLGERINAMYIDKLDGKIGGDFYDRFAGEWREEQLRLQREIDRHESTEQSYMDEGVQLLELARNAQRLFERQEPRQKRRLLNFLLSNCSWADGEMTATFRQPFDLLAETTAIAARQEAGAMANSGKTEIWLGD